MGGARQPIRIRFGGYQALTSGHSQAAAGRLTALGQTASEQVPRAFSLDPDGKFLYAAGLESGRLAAYRIAQDSGVL